MADQSGNSPPYGNFGQATYDPDERTWHFGRLPSPGQIFVPLGEAKLVHGPGVIPDQDVEDSQYTAPPSKRHPQQVQLLIKQHPEIRSASNIISPLLRVSEAIVSETTKYGSSQGSLLAVGTILHEGHHPAQVAAFSGGPLGNELRIVQLRTQRQGWDDSKHIWIEVPTVHGEEATWSSEGPPIQQVCFAHALERSDDFLAVRTTTRTVIFRPRLRNTPTKGAMSSRLDANPVFQLPISMTGRVLHTDVAFNPWYVRQFGVVDQAGHWSVWDIEGRKTYTAKRVGNGCIYDSSTNSATVVADGWARLTWICNPGIIAVSTRTRLVLTSVLAPNDMAGYPPKDCKVLDLGALQPWILDVVPMPSHPSRLCVLTSDEVRIYTVTSHGSNVLAAKLGFSLKHYRNPNDTTISLTIQEDEEWITLLLRSCVDPIVTSFGIRIEERGDIVSSDVTSISMPSELKGLHFVKVQSKQNAQFDSTNSIAANHQDRGVSFRSLFCLRMDLTLLQQLYFTSASSTVGLDVAVPTWKARLPAKTAHRLPKEQFVVSDRDEDGELVEVDREEPSSVYVQRRKQTAAYKCEHDYTVSFKLTTRALATVDQQDTRPVKYVLNVAAESWSQEEEADQLVSRTLRELVSNEIIVGDVEEASLQLQDLAITLASKTPRQEDDAPLDVLGTRPVLHQIKMPTFLCVGQPGAEYTLSTIYDSMVNDWITPLGPNVLDEIRLTKEQLIRRAAAEVALAACVVRMETIEEQQPPPESQGTEKGTYELAVRGGMPSSSQMPLPSSQYLDFSSQLQSSQPALPTPSTSAGNSIVTGSSHLSTLAPPPITRLRKYTTFSKPTTPALPRALRSVLSHWIVGEDPSNYDWLSTSRRETRRAEEEVDSQTMTEKERARVQRRAARHLRQQRREAAASQASQFASSQALEIAVSASQPAKVVESQPLSVVPSSQTVGGGGMPSASQVVPGRFGGRPPAKKKRKQGF